MKKIGKNTKLYLIGMIIGGITLGITTVIADTIINSTSVAYKTTTVKAALDELYGLSDLKPRIDALEKYFINNPSISIVGDLTTEGSEMPLKIDFLNNGVVKGRIAIKNENNDSPYFAIAGKDGSSTSEDGKLGIWGRPLEINGIPFESTLKVTRVSTEDKSINPNGDLEVNIPLNSTAYLPLIAACSVRNALNGGTGSSRINLYYYRLDTSNSRINGWINNFGTSTAKIKVECDVLWIVRTSPEA